MLILTVREIKELAEFAGLSLHGDSNADDMDSEISITTEPMECIDDNGKVERYAHVAHFADYPEEGCMPLGEPIAA